MENRGFLDYYEILEISPNANSGTIERMFRYFAQRYHPDNRETGDRVQFDLVLEANRVLTGSGVERDVDIQHRLLSILYAKRRAGRQRSRCGQP